MIRFYFLLVVIALKISNSVFLCYWSVLEIFFIWFSVIYLNRQYSFFLDLSKGWDSMKGLKIRTKYRMLLFLTSSWMIGAGFRFIMMRPSDIYTYSLFDKFFDWGIMFVLGLILFGYTLYGFYVEQRVDEKMVWWMDA